MEILGCLDLPEPRWKVKLCLDHRDQLEEMAILARPEYPDRKESEANVGIWDNRDNQVFQENAVSMDYLARKAHRDNLARQV